eukprot:6214132-Pleurochrysis_carterae.AAC.3
MISGIILEWQEANDKEKKGTISTMKLWTGEMMNRARIQMKTWIERSNEHRANVQHRWDNRGKTNKAFMKWKKATGCENKEKEERKENEEEGEKAKTYGIKHWSRVRTIPRIHTEVKNFLQMGIR